MCALNLVSKDTQGIIKYKDGDNVEFKEKLASVNYKEEFKQLALKYIAIKKLIARNKSLATTDQKFRLPFFIIYLSNVVYIFRKGIKGILRKEF